MKKECVYIYICITESLCYTAVIDTKLQFNYTSIKDKFFLKKAESGSQKEVCIIGRESYFIRL